MSAFDNSYRILYVSTTTGMVCILIPTGEVSQEDTVKAVPAGADYWIVDQADIPQDRSFRDAWELDTDELGTPTGTGV